MKKITGLTKEQEDQIPIYINQWTEIGLSTEPADRPAAEEGIRRMYHQAKIPHPHIIWTGSPLGNAKALADTVPQEKRQETIHNSVSQGGYGQHDANWVGFYMFFREVCGLVKETDPLVGITMVTKSAGWYLPHQNTCWISERHNVLHRNQDGALHCETGPALSYPDGFSIYAWNGVRVPQRLIMEPETYTKDEVFKADNTELRRTILDRIGWEKAFEWLGKPTHTHTDDTGTLYTFKDGDTPFNLIQLKDSSTARQYILRVPPTVKRAREAVAWTFSMPEELWSPAKET
jgi:hypothetical protein